MKSRTAWVVGIVILVGVIAVALMGSSDAEIAVLHELRHEIRESRDQNSLILLEILAEIKAARTEQSQQLNYLITDVLTPLLEDVEEIKQSFAVPQYDAKGNLIESSPVDFAGIDESLTNLRGQMTLLSMKFGKIDDLLDCLEGCGS